jgi:hypothetical protein
MVYISCQSTYIYIYIWYIFMDATQAPASILRLFNFKLSLESHPPREKIRLVLCSSRHRLVSSIALCSILDSFACILKNCLPHAFCLLFLPAPGSTHATNTCLLYFSPVSHKMSYCYVAPLSILIHVHKLIDLRYW